MPRSPGDYLTKRQQQIMEVLYRHGEADVATVLAGLSDPPTNPALRALLRTLEEEGHVTHVERDGKFIYRPTRPRQAAARTALVGLLRTFFDDSLERAVQTLLSVKAGDLDPDELERLKAMIDAAKARQGLPDNETPEADR